MRVRKAVIPVAGLGTRFLPFTKATPKEMLPIVDRPALQLIVEEASAAGIEEILFVTNRGKTAIENHFDHNVELEMALEAKGKADALEEVRAINKLANIFYVRQNETKGLGHAVLCAKAFVGKEPFAVLLGDDVVYNPQAPCIGQLIRAFEQTGHTVVGCQRVAHEEISKYGSLEGSLVRGDLVEGTGMEGRLWTMDRVVEKPAPEEAPSDMAVLGRYVLEAEIFDYLEKTPPGVGGEIQLTDAICALAQDGPAYGYDFAGRRYDIGDKQGFLEATIEYALRDEKLAGPFEAYLRDRFSDPAGLAGKRGSDD